MEKKEKAMIFYVLGFLTFVITTMVDRYVADLPAALHILLMIIGAVFLVIGLKLTGKKINWDFDFSPSQKKRRR